MKRSAAKLKCHHAVTIFLLLSSAGISVDLLADTPLGWINSNNVSAYTTTKGELELSGSIQAVNGTIDFLDIREDLFAANQRLAGNSGDLSGFKLEAHYGITDFLSAFARYQQHDLTVDLGEISSVRLLEIDDDLDTTQQEIGIKWTLYESDLLNPDNRNNALSLQLTGFKNETDNFDVTVDQVFFSNVTVTFLDPTTFSVSNLEDEGWTSRLLYTRYLDGIGFSTLWGGYGESTATSGTSTNAINGTIRNLFTQDFETEESYLFFGASLNFQINPRLPVTISYEYINISDSEFNRNPIDPPSQLPGFLRSSGPSEESGNHTLSARVSYWLTPEVNVSFTGNLYSNQFLGRLPHYNNPLSESFASAPYGFIGAELGYRF
ncbi:MAG: hypothetical protein MI746_07935 [Pseudomonadales bacterium]|nr:hypothetical protein [Pseudomonadales bacterium]